MSHTGIAIVGLAAQIPSGEFSQDDLDYHAFWQFLLAEGKAYEALAPVLFSSDQMGNNHELRDLPAQGAFLKNCRKFDYVSFGISQKDARIMPFAARRLTEIAFRALSDSGIDYRNQPIGCFTSGSSDSGFQDSMNADGSFAWVPSAMANRISYVLNLTGPSIQVDTACSSSLSALHLAIRAIESGDCSAAVVGAAQVNRHVDEWYNYAAGGVLSPEGTTKPFDESANGFGRGEGAIAIVIKPLEAALRDKDQIYSVISGSAINSTGSLMPLNVPSGVAQMNCIQTAYARAGRHLGECDYAELHITGTTAGDHIEANAAGKVFSRATELLVGSVKGNIVHLESAAFLASVLKCCHILQHRVIPPTVNFTHPSSSIEWQRHHLRVPTESTPLPCSSSLGHSIISISGAGIGGSTGHVLIETPPPNEPLPINNFRTAPVAFVVGGLSPRAVAQISQTILAASLSEVNDSRQCAVTLFRRARQLPWRTFFSFTPGAEVQIPLATIAPSSPPPVVFIFSGQGPQNLAMGRQLFTEFPVFRQTILELDLIYERETGSSLVQSTGLFGARNTSLSPLVSLSDAAWPVTITVSAIAMLQMALIDLLRSVGVVPSSLAGHSTGETALLYASGAGPKAMAMEIAIARGQAMMATENAHGGMISLSCSANAATDIIAEIRPTGDEALEISCYNSPNSVAISGSPALLQRALDMAKSQGISAQMIRTHVPGHCSLMDKIQDDYMVRMATIFSRHPGSHVPKIPVFSTCRTLARVAEFTPSYYWDNCRNPVLFSTAISNIIEFHDSDHSTHPIFFEISCHAVLSSSILAHGVDDKLVLCPMRRQSSRQSAIFCEHRLFIESLARMVVLGYNSCDIGGIYGPSTLKPAFLDHPLKQRLIPPPKAYVSNKVEQRTMDGPLTPATLKITSATHPQLAQHVINGEPILPATAFLEMILEAGAKSLWDVEFVSLFSVTERASATLSLERCDAHWILKSPSLTANGTARVHARGLMASSPPSIRSAVDLSLIWNRLQPLDMDGFYKSLEPIVKFGPSFQRVLRCHGDPSEAVAEIRGPSREELLDGYRIHPAVLDACIHIVLHFSILKQDPNEAMYLPSSCGRFDYYDSFTPVGNWFSHIRRCIWAPDAKSYDIVVTDRSGAVICRLLDLNVRRVSVNAPTVKRRLDLIFQPVGIDTSSLSRKATYDALESQPEAETLYRVLDSLAVDMLCKSLKEGVTAAPDFSRQRYLDFAQRAIKRSQPKTVADDATLMRHKYPAHFEVTSRISGIHKTVFQTSERAIEKLYSDNLMTRFYSRESQNSSVYLAAVKRFSTFLQLLRKCGKRAIKILEVGAGTGLLTGYLMEELDRNSDLLAEYTVSDISYALAADLAHTFNHRRVTPKAYDLTAPPKEQGLLPEYDLIVGLHVLHASPDITFCLSSLKTLLVPGGSLVVVELDGSHWGEKAGGIWFDCVFGSFSEWFGFTDGRTHCTMTPTTWREKLDHAGFANIHISIEGQGEGHNFLFSCQNGAPSTSPTEPLSILDPDSLLLYSFVDELQLQPRLRSLGGKPGTILYLLALDGQDGHGAMGFVASLRREFPSCDIRLAIFESAADLASPGPIILSHLRWYENGEHLILFPRKGTPCVPRLVVSAPPHAMPDDHALLLDNPEDLLVEIIYREQVASMNAFVGQVIQSCAVGYPPGTLVTGITDQNNPQALSTMAIHAGCVLLLDEHTGSGWFSDPVGVIPHVVATMAMRRLRPQGHRPCQVVVALEDEPMVAVMSQYLHDIQDVAFLNFNPTAEDKHQTVDMLITDSTTIARCPHMRFWVPRSGHLFIWDTALRQHIRDRTWEITSALQKSPPLHRRRVDESDTLSRISTRSPIFHHQKAYLLLGGIGGLGFDLAVWMYQHGARHIVLTSRRGVSSLDPQKDSDTLCKLSYLRSRVDLDLQLERCDATDPNATSALLSGLRVPIAGCFQMTLVLADALFVNQVELQIRAVHDSKVQAFKVFAQIVDIKSLDFYVAFSSLSGLMGFSGQSNYASACTALNGILSDFPNAYSFVVPGITDAGYLDRADHLAIDKSRNAGYNMSARQLWTYLEDGLRKLSQGAAFNQYIPDLDWSSIHAVLPLPIWARHLGVSDGSSSAPRKQGPSSEDETLRKVLSILEVEKEDFDFGRPLITYGLDSIGAARLSLALKPLTVSQFQLLAGVTWSDLRRSLGSISDSEIDARNPTAEVRPEAVQALDIIQSVLEIDARDFDPNVPLTSYGLDSLGATKLAMLLRPYLSTTQLQLLAHASWSDLQKLLHTPHSPPTVPLSPATTVVEVSSGGGTPLIVFPGGDGNITPLFALQPHFSGTLWALEVDQTMSIPALARVLTQHIREKQPHGPYRLAAYSASGVLSVCVARLLEKDGQRVCQLSFIDHFPGLWTTAEMDLALRERKISSLIDKPLSLMIDMLRSDPLYAESENIANLEAALTGSPVAPNSASSVLQTTRQLAGHLLEFLVEFFPVGDEPSRHSFPEAFRSWFSAVDAPMSVLVAEFGIVTTLSSDLRDSWIDLGASKCSKAVEVHFISGVGHYGILGSPCAAKLLGELEN
ncbi:hypothetical protein DFH06DRAFT_1482051 [Mycena polygramma]|nr:hypothetical protein DFH06DRAFT_1482051 [Mycena polygramma]